MGSIALTCLYHCAFGDRCQVALEKQAQDALSQSLAATEGLSVTETVQLLVETALRQQGDACSQQSPPAHLQSLFSPSEDRTEMMICDHSKRMSNAVLTVYQ